VEDNAVPGGIKGRFTGTITVFTDCTLTVMEVVIDYEYLSGARGDVIKEVSLASENVIDTFRI
jgi:hypothetical protein